MLDERAVAGHLTKWGREYLEIADLKIQLPTKFYEYLAKRLAETGFAEHAWDTVRARIGGKERRIRVVKFRKDLSRVQYEDADGMTYGFGLCVVDDIVAEDRSRLARIIDKLEGV